MKKQNSVTHHKANYASGLSFTLPLVCRLHQNATVGRIISQLISNFLYSTGGSLQTSLSMDLRALITR